MSGRSVEVGTIRQHCKTLRMPTVASQCHKLAEQARRDKQSHVRYLDVLLSAEVEEREHRAVQRRLKEAQLPRTEKHSYRGRRSLTSSTSHSRPRSRAAG